MEAPKPTFDEEQRLQALYDSEILDTEREQIFDNLTKLVGTIFDVPIVAISLVDKNRQWFKSSTGLDVCETHRDVSFCGHAVHDTAPFVVSDARKDERFQDNPLVKGGPKIAFYAGVPLKYGFRDGQYQIGTLCIIDTKPRDLSTSQLDILKGFATEVELLVEQRLERDSSVVANQAKSTFLANMSHELRTPIAGVLGVLSVLNDSPLNEDQKHKLSLASQSANQLLYLINDILDFSKIEADKLRLDRDTFLLTEVFGEIQKTFELIVKEQNNKLSVDLKWPDNLAVSGDAYRLKQILNNLLSNANKFTHDGDIRIEANIETSVDGSIKLTCSVIDSGIGITEEDLPKLFQAFEQLENAPSRRFGGSGLGLIISQKLCKMMGGDIQVESIRGEGSSFKFCVYLQAASIAQLTPHSESETVDTQPCYEGYKLLLVEDDLTNRLIIEHFLKSFKIDFDTYENGQQVCNALRNNSALKYQLIVTDCQMPEIDGFQLTQKIRSGELGHELIDIPIIALTANALKGDREKCLDAGMNDYLGKPVTASELVDKINHWLNISVS